MLDRAHHRLEIAGEGGEAVVAREQVDDIAPPLAAMGDLEARDGEPLGVDIGRVEGEAARILAAGIALMRLKRVDQDQLAIVVIDRRIDIIVGQMAAAIIGIVAEEEVAGAPVIFVIVHQPVAGDELRRIGELRRADRYRGKAAMRVEHARIAFVRLVDHRRRRGAAEESGGLEAGRLERAPDDARGHRIDIGRGRQRRPLGGQLPVQRERHVIGPF